MGRFELAKICVVLAGQALPRYTKVFDIAWVIVSDTPRLFGSFTLYVITSPKDRWCPVFTREIVPGCYLGCGKHFLRGKYGSFRFKSEGVLRDAAEFRVISETATKSCSKLVNTRQAAAAFKVISETATKSCSKLVK